MLPLLISHITMLFLRLLLVLHGGSDSIDGICMQGHNDATE